MTKKTVCKHGLSILLVTLSLTLSACQVASSPDISPTSTSLIQPTQTIPLPSLTTTPIHPTLALTLTSLAPFAITKTSSSKVGLPTPTPTLSLAQANDILFRQLLLSTTGPVEMTLTDAQGRRLGYQSSGLEPFSEIPFGVYVFDTPDSKLSLLVRGPEIGEYTFVVTATGEGDYSVLGFYQDQLSTDESLNLVFEQGQTKPGSVKTYSLTIPYRIIYVPSSPQLQPTPPEVVVGKPVTFTFSLEELIEQVPTLTPPLAGTPSNVINLTQKISWDFGDGNSAEDLFSPSHIYSAPGVYTVTRTETDAANQTVTYTTVITVTASSP